MKITPKIFHLPPYLSTAWSDVRAIYHKDGMLTILLLNGHSIEIPKIDDEIKQQIFSAHASFLQEKQEVKPLPLPNIKSQLSLPFQVFHLKTPLDIPPHIAVDSLLAEIMNHTPPTMRMQLDSMETIANSMQHNPKQANTPDIPQEILHKIAQVAKIVVSNDIESIPPPEPHCNCPHCQIARVIHKDTKYTEESEGLTAKEELPSQNAPSQDLTLQGIWEIQELGKETYTVKSRSNPSETYSVTLKGSLGNTFGCTCGQFGCEHLIAVLKS